MFEMSNADPIIIPSLYCSIQANVMFWEQNISNRTHFSGKIAHKFIFVHIIYRIYYFNIFRKILFSIYYWQGMCSLTNSDISNYGCAGTQSTW